MANPTRPSARHALPPDTIRAALVPPYCGRTWTPTAARATTAVLTAAVHSIPRLDALVPRLKRDPANWIVLSPFRPRLRPIDQLAKTLALKLGSSSQWPALRDKLKASGGVEALATMGHDLQARDNAPNATVLLCIDQAEELFTIADATEAKQFLELLSASADPSLPFLVLLVLRSDYLDRLQRADGLGAPFDEISLKPLPLERLGEIIRGPAGLARIGVEDHLVIAATQDAAAATEERGVEPILPRLDQREERNGCASLIPSLLARIRQGCDEKHLSKIPSPLS